MPSIKPFKKITVVDGVDGTISSTEFEQNYTIEGTETLTGNWNVTFSGTPVAGMLINITYKATVTLGGNNIVILGSTFPTRFYNKEVYIYARYDGSSWDVMFLPDFQESDIVDTDNIKDDAITTAKILDANVTTAKIADANVTLAKLATDSVDENKIVSTVFGTTLSGGSGSKLEVASGGIGVTQLATDAVETIKIKDLNVTNAKLAGSIALSKLVALSTSKVLVSDGSGEITASSVTSTTLGYLDATSSIQTQIDAKMGSALTDTYMFIGNGSNVATGRQITGDIGITNTGVTSISTGVIVNADINASAAISFSKLQALATGSIIVGNAGAATGVALGGDATIDAAGSLTLANNAITTAKITDGDITVTKLTSDLQKEVIIAYVAWEDSDWIGTQKIYIPYKCSLSYISASVAKTIGATDSAYVEFKDDAGNTMAGTGLTGGKIEFSAADAVSTTKAATPTSNNDFSAGDYIQLAMTKATANGGFAVVSLEFTRED
jgi:hypothetical protein